MKTKKDYVPATIWLLYFALGLLVILWHPKKVELLNPIVYPMNGGIFNSDYIPAEIK